MKGIISVSYTHLDVYKRQNHRFYHNVPSNDLFLRLVFPCLFLPSSFAESGVTAFIHLFTGRIIDPFIQIYICRDVYKRQFISDAALFFIKDPPLNDVQLLHIYFNIEALALSRLNFHKKAYRTLCAFYFFLICCLCTIS